MTETVFALGDLKGGRGLIKRPKRYLKAHTIYATVAELRGNLLHISPQTFGREEGRSQVRGEKKKKHDKVCMCSKFINLIFTGDVVTGVLRGGGGMGRQIE